jgi:endoglucanase
MFCKIQKQALALMLGAVVGSPSAFGAMSYLHTHNQDIVDEKGNKVMLRGVSLGNWTLPEGYMWQFGNKGDRPRRMEQAVTELIGQEKSDKFWKEFRKNYITQADIDRIAELGFNSVRPSLNARLFLSEGANPVYQQEGFELMDSLIAWCNKKGIYVILDLHAAPGGQTGRNIDDSANDQPGLFMDKMYQDRTVDLWVKIATRYKDEPAVAGYDLLNEPLPSGAPTDYRPLLEPLYKRITQAIREVDKKHMIILEGANWANDWSVFSTRFDDNSVYQFHYYCWDNPVALKSINQFVSRRDSLNAPVWVGETGESQDAIYWATTEYFEQNNIGWSLWPYKKINSGNCVYNAKAPQNWSAVTGYTQGREKPSAEVAEKAFNELLENIQFKNCTYHPNVVQALLRLVPGRVEAENYGFLGLNKSYSVKTTNNSKFYRKSEPVQIVQIQGGGYGIQLSADEWTAYNFQSLAAQNCNVALRVKAEAVPCVMQVSIGEKTQSVSVTNTGWAEIVLNAIPVPKGAGNLKYSVKEGTVNVDWAEFRTATENIAK